MKYYLVKGNMALYKKIGQKTSRFIDVINLFDNSQLELLILTKEQAEQEIKMLDNHFGEYGWVAVEYKEIIE